MIMKAVHARRTFNRDDPFAIDELPAGQQPVKIDPSHTWVVEHTPADEDVPEGGRAPRSICVAMSQLTRNRRSEEANGGQTN